MKNFLKSLFGLGKKEKESEKGKKESVQDRKPSEKREEKDNRYKKQGERRKPRRRPQQQEENQPKAETEERRPQKRRKPRRKPRPKQEGQEESSPAAQSSKERKPLPRRQKVVTSEESTAEPKPKAAKPAPAPAPAPETAPPAPPADPVPFSTFKLHDQVMEGLDAMNFHEATPVQQLAIPHIIQNKDLIACAQTGTGKTAAFLLPILHNILETDNTPHLDTLVIAPTRELAQQIDHQLIGLAYFTGVSSQAVYGGGSGQEFEREKKAFQTGANIVVATPGKLIQHMNLGYVDTSRLKHLVLDEADRMLDMGFHDDIMRIVSKLPTDRQTLLFSATMPPKIRQLASKILKDPAEVNIAISKTAEGVHQSVYSVHEDQKLDLLTHILDREGLDSVIVFTSRKSSVRAIEKALQGRKINAKGISSDLEQKEREEVLRDFRNRNTQVLVATDIMSRGIDIADLDMVINYDVPNDAEDYVHRVGRTARAKSTGEAITFVTPKEQRSFYQIESLIGREVEKPALPGDMGEGPGWMDPDQARRKGGRSGGGGRGRSGSSGQGRRNSNGPRRQKPSAEGGGEGKPDENKPRRRKNYRRKPRPQGGQDSGSKSAE